MTITTNNTYHWITRLALGSSGQVLTVDAGQAKWMTLSADVVGPASSTDNAVARYDLATGKVLQNSVVTIADTSGNMAGVGTISSAEITSSSLTASRALVSGASKEIQSSSVTATELGYVSGVTSAIQTQLDVLQTQYGIVPVGGMVPIASNLTGSYTMPVSGAVSAHGWMLADGAAIPGGNTLSGTTPNLSDSRFLLGSTTAGTTGGASSITLTITNLPSHTHGLANHTHTMSHTHSIDHNHAAVTSGNVSAGHTHTYDRVSTGAAAPDTAYGSSWGNRSFNTGAQSANHTHSVDLPNFTGTSGAASSSTTSVPSSNTSNATGSGTSFSILPTYISCVYLIRVK